MINSEFVEVQILTPHPRNYNHHSERQIAHLVKSLKKFGQYKNVVIDGKNRIIAGHGVVEAAKRRGMTEIEVKRYSHLSEVEILSLLIADNEIARQAEADNIELAILLDELKKTDESVPGIDEMALSGIINNTRPKRTLAPKDGIDETLTNDWGVEEGQLWRLGNHRLICGDSTNKTVLLKLLDDERIGEHIVVLTDPPYGINIVHADGTIGGGGKSYAQIIGDSSTGTCKRFYRVAQEIGIINFILWGGNYYTDFLPPSSSWIVWDKVMPEGMSFGDFEMAWTSYGKASKLYRWQWHGFVRQGETDKELGKRVHPTQKPVGLHEKIMQEFGGELYIDGFLGSGSVLIAAESLGKRCFGIELSPDYVAVILQRFLDFTGLKPELVNSWS